MDDVMKEVTIETLAQGAVLEKMNIELGKVIANLADCNKDPNFTRKLVCEIAFKPGDDGRQAGVLIKTATKLAEASPFPAHIFIAENSKGGYVGVESQLSQGFLFKDNEKIEPMEKQVGGSAE